MESPFLHKAVYNAVWSQSLQHWFHATKIPRYSELTRQMADHFVALHNFHSVFVHGVIKLSFSDKFFSDKWLRYILINMISTNSWCESERFHVVYLLRDSGVQTSLVKWLHGYQADLLHRFPTLYFRSNSAVFISIVEFSKGDNSCHSQGIGKSIKDKLLKGIFRVD